MNDVPSVYCIESRQARKNHRCCECHGKIPKGESYNYHSGVWDGVGASYKVCIDCDNLRELLDRDADVRYGEGTAFGYLKDSVEGIWQEVFEQIKKKRSWNA